MLRWPYSTRSRRRGLSAAAAPQSTSPHGVLDGVSGGVACVAVFSVVVEVVVVVVVVVIGQFNDNANIPIMCRRPVRASWFL